MDEGPKAGERVLLASDALLGAVSHDMRMFLAPVKMSAQLLARNATAGQRAPAEHLLRAVERMEALVGLLRDESLLREGRFTLALRDEAALDLLEETRATFAPQAAAKRIELAVEVDGAGLAARCDRERVLQALGNLTHNALKFTPDGGEVRLAARATGAMLVLAVADSGPGLSAEDMAWLYERQRRPREGNAEGSGLGLFIARIIAEAHGGRLWASGEHGRGATFSLALPLSSTIRLPCAATKK